MMMLPQIYPTPKNGLIGHRGSSGSRPENTLPSFQHAANQNLNWIEFDIQLTKCNNWVVFHDQTLERTTNGSGILKEKNLEYLQSLDAGSWFGKKYKNTKIPTLIEALNLCHDNFLYPNIEIKYSLNDSKKHVDLLIEILDKYLPSNCPLPLISSFDLTTLELLRTKRKDIPIGYLIENFSKNTLNIFTKNNFTSIHCCVDHLTLEELKIIYSKNIPLLVYTINDPKIAKHWIKQGVFAVFTDQPENFI